MKNKFPDQFTKGRWLDDPDKWVLGLFYFNKEDGRIFPPKRSSLGWTLNFANPVSVLTVIAICILLWLTRYI